MLEKIKEYWSRLLIFTQTGYFNPKYVFLANIVNSTNDENTKMFWTGASQYVNKGDLIFDELYMAINDLKTYERLFERMEKKNGKEIRNI